MWIEISLSKINIYVKLKWKQNHIVPKCSMASDSKIALCTGQEGNRDRTQQSHWVPPSKHSHVSSSFALFRIYSLSVFVTEYINATTQSVCCYLYAYVFRADNLVFDKPVCTSPGTLFPWLSACFVAWNAFSSVEVSWAFQLLMRQI